MGDRWSADQVVALAPDVSSVAAGRRLASPASWSGLGASPAAATPAAVFGLCQGSGKNPYQTVVDLDGPAYRCSCPSRKFPCKHAIGLLLLWSTGAVPQTDAPADFAAGWLESRVERAARREETAAVREAAPVDPEAAARRASERADRVAGGLAELRRWLEDQVRSGLAGAERAGYAPFERMAARMVDAQAPGVAARLRRLPAVVASGPGWPDRLLAEYALLHLLVRAHERLDDLTPALAATVRRRVGYTVPREAVLAEPAVRDTWAVLASRDAEEDRLVTRRVWLRGERTGRDALVMSFAPAGRPLDASLVPLTRVDADLHFHSALYEGGVRDEMLKRVAAMQADGITVVVLLALSDEGAPAYDAENAAALGALGVPAFACTPDAFPDLLAVALARGDVGAWAAREQVAAR